MHDNADYAIQQGLKNGDAFTPQWIFNNLSRSYYNSLIGTDLYKSNAIKECNGWFIDQDFIPRESTSAAVVFQGVKQGDGADNTIMWCAMICFFILVSRGLLAPDKDNYFNTL